MSERSAFEVALRVYQSIHGQELIKAEKRTLERTKEELDKLGIGEQFERLFADPKTEADRVRQIINQIQKEA